jgi:hypothetical protein
MVVAEHKNNIPLLTPIPGPKPPPPETQQTQRHRTPTNRPKKPTPVTFALISVVAIDHIRSSHCEESHFCFSKRQAIDS